MCSIGNNGKPKTSWKGLDREFCCPVTCTKSYSTDIWLMNPNIMQSVGVLNYTLYTELIQSSVWYTILTIVISFNVVLNLSIGNAYN